MQPDQLTGRRIASARRDVHLSQRALAAELGVSLRTLQNYEAGKFVPYRHLAALSRLLGRTPSWLLYGQEHDAVHRLLASSRHQRGQLKKNIELLTDLRNRLVDNTAQAHAIREHVLAAPEQTQPPPS